MAAKTALSIRCDALGEKEVPEVGMANRIKVEDQLRRLESPLNTAKISHTGRKQSKFTPM